MKAIVRKMLDMALSPVNAAISDIKHDGCNNQVS